ncbi:MAG: hypothetical protein WBE80_03700 [Methylocella sp.]
MTIKPKTRKAAVAKTVSKKIKTYQELKREADEIATKELDTPWHEILDAQDALGDASSLVNAIRLMAAEMNEFEGGAFCAVADAIKAKISAALGLIEAYREERGPVSNDGA